MLAGDLDTAVGELATSFRDCFAHYESGAAGASVRSTTRSIFDDWCHRSLQASPSQGLAVMAPILQSEHMERTAVATALRELGFTPRAAENGADRVLVLSAAQRLDQGELRRALDPLFQDAVGKLCAQSAHLILARALVYRVGEDMGLFDPLLGGEAEEHQRRGHPSLRGLPHHPEPHLSAPAQLYHGSKAHSHLSPGAQSFHRRLAGEAG